MKRRVGTGLLFLGACSACFIAPLLVGLAAGGWAGALGAGWPWVVGVAATGAAAFMVLRRVQRRRRPGCACPPA